MRRLLFGTRLWRAAESWFERRSVTDPSWLVIGVLAAFAASWTMIFLIANYGSDLHPDVIEAWAYGRVLGWGTPKHPPAMVWVVSFWTRMFSASDWSLELLAAVNGAVAIWFVYLTAGRAVGGTQRVLVVLLVMLLPAYQFLAHRYNANAVLLPLWPLATFCFMRSFEERSSLWAALAGATGALAILGKYYSVFLLIGFLLAAILDARRKAYFLSPAPWISIVTGLAVLSPHIAWLVQNNFKSFAYATAVHASGDLWLAVRGSVYFLLGNAAYLALPLLVLLYMTASSGKALDDSEALRPVPASAFFLLWIFLGLLACPPVAAIALGSNLPALWNLPGLFLPIVALAGMPRFRSESRAVARLGIVIFALSLIGIAVAPAYAFYRNQEGYAERRNLLSASARQLDALYHRLTPRPLYAVSGDDKLALGVAFYSPDHPVYGRLLPAEDSWNTPAVETLQKGWVGLCFSDDPFCVDWMKRVEKLPVPFVSDGFTVQSSFLGVRGVSADILVLISPPAANVP